MNGIIKKWARRRRKSKQSRSDFSDDIRRAERREKLQRFAPVRWLRQSLASAFRFRDPNWVQSQPMTATKRGMLTRGSYLNPLVWLWGLVRFIASWITSRPYSCLLPALPAMAVILGILGLVFWYRSAGRNWRDTMYRKHLNTAMQQENHAVALVSVNTLIDQNPYDPVLRFRRALITNDLDQPQLCDYYMRQLATEDHVLAILWILQQHYNDPPIRGWDSDKQNEYAYYVTKLLEHARGEQLLQAKKMMGVYLSEMGAKAEAVEYLSQLANDQPDLLLMLAYLNAEIGDQTRARRYAIDAREYLQTVLAANPMDASVRIQLAQAMLFGEDWDGGIRILHEGRQLAPSEPRLTKALADTLAAASLQLNNPNRMKLVVLNRRFKYAAAGLKVAPDNMLVLDAVQQILAETVDSQDNAAVRTALIAELSPDTMHFVEGTLALLDNRNDDAIKHLRLAQSHGLNAPGILNNLAVAIAGREDADLEEALRLVEAALEMLPDHPYVLETRGRIFFKMERYEEAIRDLEKSLAGVKQLHLKSQIYGNLIKAYQGLGLDETAAKYQLLAEKTAEALAVRRGSEEPEQ